MPVLVTSCLVTLLGGRAPERRPAILLISLGERTNYGVIRYHISRVT